MKKKIKNLIFSKSNQIKSVSKNFLRNIKFRTKILAKNVNYNIINKNFTINF